jgi:hypothetical protein
MIRIGLRCDSSQTTNTNNKIWFYRSHIVNSLLDSNYDVLMSDTDAIWLKNPFAELNKYYNSGSIEIKLLLLLIIIIFLILMIN